MADPKDYEAELERIQNMAIEHAIGRARPGDVVLLSPAWITGLLRKSFPSTEALMMCKSWIACPSFLATKVMV